MLMQIYTTKLDRSKAKISEKEAARIAREIEGKKTNNPHEAEERGQIQYREMVSAPLTGRACQPLPLCPSKCLNRRSSATIISGNKLNMKEHYKLS